MKKAIILFAALLLIGAMSAQPRGSHNKNPHGTFPPPPQAPSILVQAQNHEVFQVYIDGDLINNVPKSEVLVENLDTRQHEVIIVLTHPARKAAATQIYAATPVAMLTIGYDMHRQQLLIYSPQPTDNHWQHAPHHQHKPPIPPTPTVQQTTEPTMADNQWVDEMVSIIKGQSFDSERLSTAKGLLNNGYLFTASQIAQIAQAFDFNNSQVDFLKAAYPYCADPQNYERALAGLTFSSDRESVRTFIKTTK